MGSLPYLVGVFIAQVYLEILVETFVGITIYKLSQREKVDL